MNKKEFLLRQIAKTNKKSYENYIVTRVIHKLDDPTLKFVTQQHVSRPGGRRALTDLYLPQLSFHVEVDEGYHKSIPQADAIRQADIIDATGHTIERIDATLPLDEMNERIDRVIDLIRERVRSAHNAGTFEAWNPEREHTSAAHIKRGYMDADEDVAFYRHADACNCFGHSYVQFQPSEASHPLEPGVTIWFPKLYENADYHNAISADEETIHVSRKRDNDEFVRNNLAGKGLYKRLVFAQVRGPLGDVMYRFKGLYEVDVEESLKTSMVTHRRLSKRVRTYQPVERQARPTMNHQELS